MGPYILHATCRSTGKPLLCSVSFVDILSALAAHHHSAQCSVAHITTRPKTRHRAWSETTEHAQQQHDAQLPAGQLRAADWESVYFLLTPFPRRGFPLLSSRHHRLKTFAKRTFPRWRALPLGRDLTRVRHDAWHGFRALAINAIWLQSASEVSLGP